MPVEGFKPSFQNIFTGQPAVDIRPLQGFLQSQHAGPCLDGAHQSPAGRHSGIIFSAVLPYGVHHRGVFGIKGTDTGAHDTFGRLAGHPRKIFVKAPVVYDVIRL